MEIQRNVLIPNLVTLGNGICGWSALWILMKVEVPPGEGAGAAVVLEAFRNAAWLIVLGMLFDVFDGKVARMSGGGSALGGQLDSLCDLVTFGLVPAVMMLRLSLLGHNPVWWERAAWFFSLAYFLGAMLRLARFTAENAEEEGAHQAFKGLPTPGAAGCVASAVVFYVYLADFKAKELQWFSRWLNPEAIREWVALIPALLPLLGLVLGYAMVSNRLIYEHMGSWFFGKKHSFDFIVYMVFGVIISAVIPEVILPLLFFGYLVWTPLRLAYHYLFAGKGKTATEHERGG
jgi:CDP-diacylglycerol--serine O-phosphatidyltransferase